MKKQFNPKCHNGKDRVQFTVQTGISKCWKWDADIHEYLFLHYEARKKGLLKAEDKRTFQSLPDAKNWLHGRVEQSIEVDKGPKFSEVFDKWKSEHFINLRRGTQIHYEKKFKFLVPLLNLPICSITPDTLDVWVMNLKSLSVRETRFNFSKELKFLKSIFSFYREHSSEAYDIPIRKRHFKKAFIREKPLVNKAILEEDFRKFRLELSNGKNGLIFAALATLQYYHSLRIGEAAGVTKFDITLGPNPVDNTLKIRSSLKWDRVKGAKPYIDKNFKNSKAVGIKSWTLHPEVTNYLKRLLPSVQGEALFTVDGKLLSYRQIQYKYNEALKKANLPFTSTHILRCGSATEFYNKHGNTALTQLQLGVTSMETAQVYAKPLQSKLNDYNQALYSDEKYKEVVIETPSKLE